MIDPNSSKEIEFQHASINWIPAALLIGTPIAALFVVPWFLWTHTVGIEVWLCFLALMTWTGMSITTGYHRLWAHRSYKAHPIVQYFLLFGGTMAVESSVYDWCCGHRSHHKYVDDEYKDPYSARRGFWFSHIGWMLRNYPSGEFDYKNIPDLKKQKMLQIQHKYYGIWVVVTNFSTLLFLGWLTGDYLGVFVLAGLLRLVVSHHFTFFINSLCHMFGTRPYTDTNTARDNFILALVTWGEGYHNYHHFFQMDYRNGVKWWQFDPTKWLIAGLSKIGLTYDLKTVDEAIIRQAQVKMQFKKAQKKIDMIEAFNAKKENLTAVKNEMRENMQKEFDEFKARISAESEAFQKTMEEWQELKKQKMKMKKTEFSERLQEVDDMRKEQVKQIEAKINEHSKHLEEAFSKLRSANITTKALS